MSGTDPAGETALDDVPRAVADIAAAAGQVRR
jgi:hypothetical protein